MAVKEKILVVDDEPSIRKYLQTLLEVDGFDVETVSSGREAIEKVGANRPDFIILDVLMPEMNGIETLKELLQFISPAGDLGEELKPARAAAARCNGRYLGDIPVGIVRQGFARSQVNDPGRRVE